MEQIMQNIGDSKEKREELKARLRLRIRLIRKSYEERRNLLPAHCTQTNRAG
jgi:hypothetical protein